MVAVAPASAESQAKYPMKERMNANESKMTRREPIMQFNRYEENKN